MALPDVAPVLPDLLREALGSDGVTIERLRPLSGGASRQTWSVDAVHGDGRISPLILQRARAGAVATGGGMATEAALLRVAASSGVPVPRLVASGGADSPLGAPWLLMERLDGETIPRKILRDDLYAGARERLAGQCGRALAAIHALPPEAVPGLEEQDQLTQYRELLATLGEPHPTFELAFRRLEAERPHGGTRCVVHGDFRNGNLIVGPDGLRAVLDWELAHVGDPFEDLGWLCVRAWRFKGPGRVGGFGSREDLFAAYEEAGGGPVDVDAVGWWELLGTVKWGVMCILQAQAHLSGMSRSVELAAIGRRVCENEHDVLLLLS